MLQARMEEPVFRPAGISYLHIPTVDPPASASFYANVFGWKIGGRPEHPSFEDGTGHVIGAFESSLKAVGEAGIMIYVYVTSVDETVARVEGNGGTVAKAPYPEGSLRVATFVDPAGNMIGIWQKG